MAPKKPTVTSARRRAERASGSTKVAASTPQKRPTTTMQRPFQPGTRTRFENPSSGGSTTKSQTVGGGKNLFGGAGDKNTAIKQGGPSAPKPAFNTSRAPFSRTGPTRASIGNVKPGAAAAAAPRQQARAQGQAAVKAAQQRRANLAKVQQDLRGQVSKAGAMFGGLRGGAYQAIAESVAPRPTASYASLAAGKAKAAATMKAKAKSADSFGGQYQKPKAGAKPKPAPKMSKAKSFDNAFASARNSGMKTFVWEGKKYNTKMRGEK